MSMNTEQCAIIRYGYVSDYDAKRHMARVIFPDKDNLVSDWLPVLVHNALKNHDEVHVDIDEHVACLMLGNGIEAGLILGAIYDNENRPVKADNDIRSVKFSDGTSIIYDRKEHRLAIDCKGDIAIHATGNIKLTASRIDLN